MVVYDVYLRLSGEKKRSPSLKRINWDIYKYVDNIRVEKMG